MASERFESLQAIRWPEETALALCGFDAEMQENSDASCNSPGGADQDQKKDNTTTAGDPLLEAYACAGSQVCAAFGW